ncbi:MAG: hypothetical protein HYV28_17115 [Ignavibacteriales bacterium]|nr:hypothetical protein [Ignavibacteriales bacterium]
MKTLLSLLITVLALTAAAQNLQVKIQLEKKEYYQGDYVELLFELKNSGSDILIDGLFIDNITSQIAITITDEHGKIVAKSHEFPRGLGFLFPRKLKKGCSFFEMISLSGYFGNENAEEGVGISGECYYFKPGRYQVNVCYTFEKYQEHNENGGQMWSVVENSAKPILSNTLVFTVVKPKTVNDQYIYNTLKQIQRDIAKGTESNSRNHRKNSINQFKELIRKYPRSIYLDVLYMNLIMSYYFTKQHSELLNLTAKVMEKFPDRWMIYGPLNILRSISQTDKSYISAFEQLVVKNQNKGGFAIWNKVYNVNKTSSKSH